ncbi:MAG: transposase, partial [Planctomycetes bacterium]|nr:transposase [Planctomycetota bacterium]
MFTAGNIHYELADRVRGLASGGIGAIHLLARKTGLIDQIDRRLDLLKIHLPYHESDHALNIAYNILCNGTCLEDIELRRNDEVFLDALGADRIPDPTTAGDFCRRFGSGDIEILLEVINRIRQKVWARQPTEFFELAKIDMDGSLVSTTGECKKGMDISYNGVWGYHPLLISLANTREILDVFNRSGNRPSYEGAAARVDKAIQLCLESGFRHILLRGDNDFSQTAYLDGWDDDSRVTFIFGMDNDTVGAAQKTLDKIRSWPPGLPVFGQLTPFPSTPLYDRLLSSGRLERPKHWMDFAPFVMAHKPLKMTIREARQEVDHAWRSSYSPQRNREAIEYLASKPIGEQITHLCCRIAFRGID